jgi:hypothetical protein
MTSAAQVAANRRNGRKSRGPRTGAGKLRASRNALRHGLAGVSRLNPAYFPQIERIAKAYCEGDTDPLLLEQALIIAENDVVLMCVNEQALAAIARMRDPDAIPFSHPKASLVRARARFAQAQRTHAVLVKTKERAATVNNVDNSAVRTEKAGDLAQEEVGNSAADCATTRVSANDSVDGAQAPDVRARCDEFEAIVRAQPDLRRLERYQRRATSRRNRAIEDFIFIKSMRRPTRASVRNKKGKSRRS